VMKEGRRGARSCFVGQPILAAAGFQPALFTRAVSTASHPLGLPRTSKWQSNFMTSPKEFR
jgi:hypothetical protein